MSAQTVKIAATSDIHGFLERFEDEILSIDPDILMIAGDIHPCTIDINSYDWFYNAFFPMVKRIKIPVIAIPGNHDFYLTEVLAHGFEDFKKSRAPKNFFLLCDDELYIDGLRFYGTPWCNYINGQWCFEASHETLKYMYSKIPYRVDFLISHTPPEIKHQYIDISMDRPERYWRHFGSRALTEEIKKKLPRFVICGHIHSGDHNICEVRYGDKPLEAVPCFNVSRVNEAYKVAYPVKELTINF